MTVLHVNTDCIECVLAQYTYNYTHQDFNFYQKHCVFEILCLKTHGKTQANPPLEGLTYVVYYGRVFPGFLELNYCLNVKI